MDLSKAAVVVLAGGKGQRLEPLTPQRDCGTTTAWGTDTGAMVAGGS